MALSLQLMLERTHQLLHLDAFYSTEEYGTKAEDTALLDEKLKTLSMRVIASPSLVTQTACVAVVVVRD